MKAAATKLALEDKAHASAGRGEFPNDWTLKSIETVATVIRGASPRPKGDRRFYGGDVPRLMVEDVTRDGKFVTPQVDFLTAAGRELSRPCKAGTLTLVCSGTVGIPSFLAVDACIHDGFIGLISISSDVSTDYLYHQLASLREQLDGTATHGGIFTNLTTEGVKAFQICFPPTRTEQEAIAVTLSDADALIEGLERLIAKKRAIKQGAMQDLLSGRKRLPGFSAKWEARSLGELCGLKSGDGITSARIDTSSPFPCYGGNGLRGYTRTYTHSGRYALIGRVGALCGNVLVAEGQFFASEHAIVVTPKEFVSLDWLALVLDQLRLNRFSEASAQPVLTVSKIAKLELRLPGEKSEQQAIADNIADVEFEIAALDAKLAKTRSLKQGMMQELLTGRTRLE